MDLSKLSDSTLKSLYDGKPLDYSKLSDDELKELTSVASASQSTTPSNNVSPLTSAINGGLNFASLGHLPQVYGAIDHPLGALKSLQGITGKNVSSDPDVQNYAQSRDQWKGLINNTEQAHPLAYLGGGLAAGLALPNPVAAAESLGGKLAVGAGLGAAFGEGGSNADLAKGQVGQDLKDAGIGGALGLGTSLIGEGAGAALGEASQGLANKSETYQRLLNAYNKGLAGKSIIGPEAQREAGEQLSATSKDLSGKLLQIRQDASDNIGDIVDSIKGLKTGSVMNNIGADSATAVQATPSIVASPEYNSFNGIFKKYLPILGDKVENVTSQAPSDILNSAGEELSNPITSQVTQEASVNGKDLGNFRKELNQLLGKTKSPEVRQLVKNSLGRVDEAFQVEPKYVEANQELKRLSDQFPELFLNKWVSKYKPSEVGDVLSDKLSNSIVKANKSGFTKSKSDASGDLNTLFERFKDEEANNPGFLKNIGIDNLDQYMGGVKDVGQSFDNATKVATQSHNSGINPMELLGKVNVLGIGAKTGQGKNLLSANRVGQAVGTVKDLFSYPTEKLSGVLPILRNAGLDSGADMLEKGMAQGGQAKNVALFSLLQQPQARDILNAHAQNQPDQGGQ